MGKTENQAVNESRPVLQFDQNTLFNAMTQKEWGKHSENAHLQSISDPTLINFQMFETK